MALAIWAPLSANDREKVEADYAATKAKYSDDEWRHCATAFALLVEALEAKREEFLGHCMNLFEATNKWGGQVLTPISLSRLMAEITCEEPRDEVVTLHDPCCGAGVLVIEGAEVFMEKGWAQRNLCIVAGDIDGRACDMAYVQLSLLGYAAVVRHQNALTQETFGGSPVRYTPGWYLHNFPMRGISA